MGRPHPRFGFDDDVRHKRLRISWLCALWRRKEHNDGDTGRLRREKAKERRNGALNQIHLLYLGYKQCIATAFQYVTLHQLAFNSQRCVYTFLDTSLSVCSVSSNE
jgi:hypothetical protein